MFSAPCVGRFFALPLRMRLFNLVSDVAGRQSGVISREQLIELGFTASAIQRAVSDGTFVRLHQGIYRVASAPGCRDSRLWAAVLWGGQGAVLSHLTAAWLWKLDGLGLAAPDEIDVSVPARRVVLHSTNVRIHRVNVLEPVRDFATFRRFPCTSLARTVVDLAAVLPADELESAFNSAVRRDKANRDAIEAVLRRLGTRGRIGLASLVQIALRDDLGVTDSRLEDKVRIALRRAGIPVPIPQLEIPDIDGFPIGRFDFAWPEKSVVVCCDSWQFHAPRYNFEKDRRDSAALIAAGWAPIPITWRRLHSDCDGFIRELKEALARGRPISM